MTDPLSLSGTAVGIVSFGLTVCQHLVEYCSSVKGCDKEASSIANKANGLQSTLNVVRELAAKGDLEDNPVFADVLNKVITCEEGENSYTREEGLVSIPTRWSAMSERYPGWYPSKPRYFSTSCLVNLRVLFNSSVYRCEKHASRDII
ncbi:hypothetical protein M432DRAFT_78805 [Thermoascus aurantiacus ATCC 26904]